MDSLDDRVAWMVCIVRVVSLVGSAALRERAACWAVPMVWVGLCGSFKGRGDPDSPGGPDVLNGLGSIEGMGGLGGLGGLVIRG